MARTMGVEITQCLRVSFPILLVFLMVLLIMLLYKQGHKQNGAMLTLSLREQNKTRDLARQNEPKLVWEVLSI